MALTARDLVAAAQQQIRQIAPAQAMLLVGKVLILDVREPAEHAAGCLPGAINIPRGVLEFKIDSHPVFKNGQETEILVYCLTGGRSALAVEALQKLGYSKLVSLAGGFQAWREAGGPVVTPAAG